MVADTDGRVGFCNYPGCEWSFAHDRSWHRSPGRGRHVDTSRPVDAPPRSLAARSSGEGCGQ